MNKAQQLNALCTHSQLVESAISDYKSWMKKCKAKGASFVKEHLPSGSEIIQAIKGNTIIGLWTDNQGGLIYGNEAMEPEAKDGEAQKVPGGLIRKLDITPAQYKERVDKMQSIYRKPNKRWNSLFTIFKVPNKEVFHLFHLMFDKDEYDNGAMNPERANRIKYVGAFNSADAAKKYLTGGAEKGSLGNDKRVTLHHQKDWTTKEMGV